MKLLYPSEPTLIKEIHQKLESLRNAWAEIPSLEIHELPSEKILSELLTTLFYLGLSKEEERLCRVSLVFVPGVKKVEVGKTSSHSFESIRFLAPSEFSLENIRKISLAFDPKSSYLCVEEQEDKLQIWGVARTQPPHTAVFRNNREGEILIDFGSEIVFRFYRGASTFFSSNRKFTSLKLSYLVNSNLPKELQETKSTNFPRARSICSIASFILGHGHGGCLLVVPERRSLNKDILHLKASNTCDEESADFLKDKLNKFTKFEKSLYENPTKANEVYTEQNNRKLLYGEWIEAMEFIGNLSCVDGAVVLAADLSLIGFGAIIKPEANDVEHSKIYLYQSILSPHERREMNISHLGGTRHKTAVAFVKRQESAFAFVASQDGILSFVWKDPNEEGVSILANLDFVLRDIK